MMSEIYAGEVVRLPIYRGFESRGLEESGEEVIIAKNGSEYIIYLKSHENSYRALVFPSQITAKKSFKEMEREVEEIFENLGYEVKWKNMRSEEPDWHIERVYPRIKSIFERYREAIDNGASEEELVRYSRAISDLIVAFRGSALCEVGLEKA